MRRAIHRVSPNANATGLSHSAASQLPNRFVSQCAAAGNHADVAPFVNVTRGDPDPAPSLGVLSFSGRYHARAVGSDEPGLLAFHRPLHLNHVIDGNAF